MGLLRLGEVYIYYALQFELQLNGKAKNINNYLGRSYASKKMAWSIS